MQNDHADQAYRYRWWVLFVLTFTYTLSFIDAKLPFILIENIKKDLNLSDTEIGLITGPAFSLVYALSAIPIARLSDRYSRKIVIAAAVLIWGAFTSAGGLAKNATHLLLSRIGVALGEAACTPAAHSLIADYFEPHQRGRALSIYLTGTTLGTVVAMIAGGLIAEFWDWRIAMIGIGALSLVAAALLIFTVKEPTRSRKKAESGTSSVSGILQMLRDPVIFHSLIAGTLVCVTLGSITAWTPAFVVRHYDLGIAVVGASLGIAGGITGIIGTLAGGFMNDMLSRSHPGHSYRWLAFTLIGGAVLKFLALCSGNFTMFLTLAALSGLLTLFYSAPTYATVQSQVDPHSRSRVSALLVFGFNGVGIAIGAFLTGYMSDLLAPSFGEDALRLSLIIMNCFCLFGAGFYLLGARALARKSRRSDPVLDAA